MKRGHVPIAALSALLAAGCDQGPPPAPPKPEVRCEAPYQQQNGECRRTGGSSYVGGGYYPHATTAAQPAAPSPVIQNSGGGNRSPLPAPAPPDAAVRGGFGSTARATGTSAGG